MIAFGLATIAVLGIGFSTLIHNHNYIAQIKQDIASSNCDGKTESEASGCGQRRGDA